ncbi:hypothetical protein ALC60_14091 [Trachymyrmex zeteki]|uniref:DUF4817 domain-containing protein n=1 Tax=Mycetomoellerius zeteki TaxID=64791 RepID=A0A151WGD0_9HYME|nr:hypothetical protein ALC60_14091 [Trachymyrmex zeteki]
MAHFDVEVNMLLILGECEKNYRRAAQLFLERYNIQKLHMAFLRLENRLRVHGQLSTIKRQKANPVVNDDNCANILAAVEINPHVSQRELANPSGVGRSSYELLETDYERRVIFCEWMSDAMINDSFLQNILFSDEATFTNTGHLRHTRHNMHYWSYENPHWMCEVYFQHRWSVRRDMWFQQDGV